MQIGRILAVGTVALIALGLWLVSREGRSTGANGGARAAAGDVAAAEVGGEARAPGALVPAEVSAQATAGRAPLARAEASRDARAETGALIAHVERAGSGQPVSAAEVVIRSRRPGAAFWDEDLVRTDAEGLVRVESLPVGLVHVLLLRGGRREARIEPGGETHVRLVLAAGLHVDGEVVDEFDRPVAGAEIWLSERWSATAGHAVGFSDAAGRFQLESVLEDQFLGARTGRRAPTFLRSVRGAPGERVSVRLVVDRPAAALAGRVLDPLGQPVGRARVLVGAEAPAEVPDEQGIGAPGTPPQGAITDPDGAFAVSGVEQGAVPLQVRAPGFAPWSEVVALDAAGTRVEVVLVPEASVQGQVRTADGAVVPRASVRSAGPARFSSSSTDADEEGRFLLAGLASGSVELVAEDPRAGAARTTLSLRAGERALWNPALEPRPTVFGRVLDAAGEPLPSMAVVLLEDRPQPRRFRSEPTDAAGRFQVSDVPQEGLVLLVQGPGDWRGFPRAIQRDVWPGTQERVVVVPDARATTGTFVGRVEDARVAPPEDVSIELWHEEQRLWRSFVPERLTGLFEIAGVPPGTCGITVRGAAHATRELGARRIEAGETVDLGTIRLAEPGHVEVAPADAAPEVLAALEWVLSSADGAEVGTLARNGGVFRSAPLAPGAYRLALFGPRVLCQEWTLAVEAGRTERLTPRLEPAAFLELLLEPPAAAQPPRSFSCALFDASDRRVWFRDNLRPRDGLLTVGVSLPPGTYRVRAETSNGLRAEGSVQVLDSEEAPTRLRLRRPEGG